MQSEDEVVASSGEILREAPELIAIAEEGEASASTKTQVAIAWLEEARLLTREENRVSVFSRSLLIGSLEEADQKLGQRQINAAEKQPYLDLLAAIFAADELQRLHALCPTPGWGGFAVIARRWEELERLAALCRQRGIPAVLRREDALPPLFKTREGNALLVLLRDRLTRRAGSFRRWFARRFGQSIGDWIDHPFVAALARFIAENDPATPGWRLVASDLVEALHEFGSGEGGPDLPNAPVRLMTAHGAKGLEFDHVLLLDGGNWSADDAERRLFYVAMTRARQTLTLTVRDVARHPFVRDLGRLPLRTRPVPPPVSALPAFAQSRVLALNEIVLSYPGHFAANAPIHRALAALEVGAPLCLRPLKDAPARWELTDAAGQTVGRLAQKFTLPEGTLRAVRVAAILVRHAKAEEAGRVKVRQWELVLPEIGWTPKAQ
jgi:ATP-dependent DNA helicase RecQ